ncbi:MAG: helix-turn-helix transcriptional regulator [Candidatus Dormibacteraeota bacterium]|nr:helix-turn-helix transcriptional regulator [Candidatus Dormibacteraeota bacterium]
MPSSSDPRFEPSQPKRFLQPCLLLLIRECSSHGYDLMERLGGFGFERDPGGMYRELRSMERDGLVSSHWELTRTGPGRRRYQVSALGMERLQAWAANLEDTRNVVDGFLARYRGLAQGAALAESGSERPGRKTDAREELESRGK